MTPKEKAIIIVGKYIDLPYSILVLSNAKQCAMIAVDEICEAIHYNYDKPTEIAIQKEWSYWQQVKREIYNL